MTTKELAKHIYNYSQNCKQQKPNDSVWTDHDDNQAVNYISYLIELHFEPQNHLGSKGFYPPIKDIRSEFGC